MHLDLSRDLCLWGWIAIQSSFNPGVVLFAQKALTVQKYENIREAQCMRRKNGKGWGELGRWEPNNMEPLEQSKEFRIYSECEWW